MRSVTLPILGMHCGACVAHAEAALKRLPGVADAAVNLATATGTIDFDPGRVSERDLRATIRRAGYDSPEPATPATPADTSAHAPAASAPAADPVAEQQALAAFWKTRALVGIALAAPVMGLMFWHALPSLFAQFALTLAAQTHLGAPFYARAWANLRYGRATMDTLVALGTTVAFAASTFALFQTATASTATPHATHATPAVYFETAAMILALVALGKWLEARARALAADALAGLASLRPATATLLLPTPSASIPPQTTDRPVADLLPGDLVLIRPGAAVPADGIVTAGHSDVDQALITGEPLPIPRSPGDRLFAGSLNTTGTLTLLVERPGKDALLDRIVRLVHAAQSRKASAQRTADAVSAVFVPIVLALALATLLLWGLIAPEAGWSTGLSAAVAVLIVACPCAMGLATPVAFMVGAAAGARRGILFKDPAAIERAGTIDTVVFDKTGTLTLGRPTVGQIVPADPGMTQNEVLRLAASAAFSSEHPLSRAILATATARNLPLSPASDFLNLPGRGVRATVEGSTIFVGRVPDTFPVPEVGTAFTRVAVVEALDTPEQRVRGVIGLADEPRPSAAAAVAALSARAIRVVMLTGDAPGPAHAVAAALKVPEVIAGVRPDEKARHVEALRASGLRVAMVGDGINDAPALAAADLGLAIGGAALGSGGAAPRASGGTDIAAAAGQILILSDDLAAIPRALALGRRINRTIKVGLFWAFAYNVALLPIAALGWLHPMLAAAAMSVSSLTVVGNALRLRSPAANE